jgi:hypothetical protein
MIETIEVDVLPLDAIFSTPGAAIAHVAGSINKTPYNDDLTSYIGKRIVRTDLYDDMFSLYLEGGAIGEFRLIGKALDFVVLQSPSSVRGRTTEIDDIVSVQFPESMYIWRRRELLASLEGNQFCYVQLSGSRMCFLCIKNVGVLIVTVSMDRRRRKPFLFWSPE